MVEAPGIEPGSESTTSKLLHAYLTYLFSDPEMPVRMLFRILSLLVLAEEQGKSLQSSLLIDVSFR